MRIIKRKTLADFWEKHEDSEQALKSWFNEVRHSEWKNTSDIKAKYRSADFITGSRIVFNIKGNKYRLIVEVKYKLKIVYIRFIGTHAEYDKIDAEVV